MSEDQGHGRFVWYDLMTTDPAAAEAFYTGVLPWTVEEMEMPTGPYRMWTLGEGPQSGIGGVSELPPEAAAGGAPPHWLSYVAVADVDASTARAGELGAAPLVPPTDIPGVGRFSVLADPQGGTICLYRSSGEPPAAASEPKFGQFSWHELATSDLDAALDFYCELFAWQKMETHDMGEMGPYQIFGQGDVPYGGVFKRPPEMPVTAWLYYARVADLDDALARVKAGGGQVANGPMDVPGGDRVAQCVDPQGAMFAFHQHNG